MLAGVLTVLIGLLLGLAVTTARTTAGPRPLAGPFVAARPAALDVPAPPTPPPLPPLPTVDTCTPGSPIPACALSTAPTAPATTTPTAPPCTGEDCIPQPVTIPPNPGGGIGTGGGGGGSDCSLWDPSTWLDCLFAGIVTGALDPLLDLLGKTLLTTPTPDSVPQLAALWTNSWQILLASYGLLVLLAGIVVMTYQTLHTRHSIKEVAPRVILGFLAGTLSLFLATKAIEIANALAYALLGGGVDASSAATAFRNLTLGALSGGVWILLVGLVLAVMLVVLLVTYLVRVALTFLLIAAAPLLLMFHALPHTDGLARWWWKAFGGVLAIQLAQSLVLAVAMNALLAHGPASLFGG